MQSIDNNVKKIYNELYSRAIKSKKSFTCKCERLFI